MTPYTFLQELADIKEFYKQASGYYSGLPRIAASLPISDPAMQIAVAQAVTQRSDAFARLQRKMVPVMLCTIWESFVDQLKVADPARYQYHFPVIKKWYSTPLQEVAFIRHCISHKNGKIDHDYLSKSTIRTFNTLGQIIDFTEPEIDAQFIVFEDAYRIITS
jgi:hypothetical protein